MNIKRILTQFFPAGFISFIFVQSLFFKYTNSPETIYIFQDKLDPWAYDLTGFHLFAQTGIFSQYVIGTAELVAATFLILSIVLRHDRDCLLRGIGALLALGIMSGAISFHLFTPLGVSVQNADGTFDGGELFSLACVNWVFALYLLSTNGKSVLEFARKFLPI